MMKKYWGKGGEQTVTQFKIREDNSYMAEEGSIKVFMSYSHEDEKYKEKLDKHLAVLKETKRLKHGMIENLFQARILIKK